MSLASTSAKDIIHAARLPHTFVRSHPDYDNEEEITTVLSNKFKREREKQP